VKIREFGIALLYYFLPVAYTDRTDAYRLRDFNSRAAIAMAGPMFDLYGAGISAAASCLTSGTAAVNFRLLMWMQVITFISNLNPLMPGDGYHVLEAWFGALNFRRRAFSLLFRRLSFRELPPNLQGLDAGQQFGHLAYAVAALAYTLLLATLFIYNIGHIIAMAFGS
jgi:putative peptide zinc metalloprotease protein